MSGSKPDQSAPGEREAPAAAADRGQLRRGIAGQLVGDGVLHLAGALVEGHDARAVALHAVHVESPGVLRLGRAAADHHDQQVALDDRRAAHAEEVLHDAELPGRIDLPQRLAVLGAHAVEHPLGAEQIDAVRRRSPASSAGRCCSPARSS